MVGTNGLGMGGGTRIHFWNDHLFHLLGCFDSKRDKGVHILPLFSYKVGRKSTWYPAY